MLNYEISVNDYQDRKNNEIRNLIFSLQLWETFLSVKVEVGMFTKFGTWWSSKILGKTLNNEDYSATSLKENVKQSKN